MKSTLLHRAAACFVCAAALFAASNASAQYIWLNEKGVKQYSDLPPSASVPQNRILKQPGGASATPSISGQSAASSEPSPADEKESVSEKNRQPLSTAEKNAEFQKRRMEQQEKEKKAAEEKQRAAEKARNCERAQAYQRSLESGERLARTDKNGERYYLNDQQRSQEQQENRRVLDTCK
jgi:hypothetical protein